jgi:hypothetical protein
VLQGVICSFSSSAWAINRQNKTCIKLASNLNLLLTCIRGASKVPKSQRYATRSVTGRLRHASSPSSTAAGARSCGHLVTSVLRCHHLVTSLLSQVQALQEQPSFPKCSMIYLNPCGLKARKSPSTRNHLRLAPRTRPSSFAQLQLQTCLHSSKIQPLPLAN